MKVLDGGNVIKLRLDQVVVESRLRGVREQQVQNLIMMAEDTGITTPIHVRKTRDGYTLIDGAHRLEAAKRMGLEMIAAIAIECRAEEARAMEASNNLGAARMTPLQTIVFAASWKRTYYEMHPERRPGVFKGNQHTKNVVTAENALTTSIADAFGRRPRQIFKFMAVADRLSDAEVRALDAAETPVSLEDLEAIGKISDASERTAVVLKIAHGSAKKVSEARRQIAVESGVEAPVKDPVEEAFQNLMKAWSRAPMAARRRFMHEFAEDLAQLEGGSE